MPQKGHHGSPISASKYTQLAIKARSQTQPSCGLTYGGNQCRNACNSKSCPAVKLNKICISTTKPF